MKKIEVVFSPALFPFRKITKDYVIVVVDILRATTTICSALWHGVESIIPVPTINEARSYKDRGYLMVGERLGLSIGGSDYGNTALDFKEEQGKGKTVVLTTTNGTVAIDLARNAEADETLIGAFSNFTVLADHLIAREQSIVILCSGWKNSFCLEDTLFAGALTEKILAGSDLFICHDDAANAAMDLWDVAREDPLSYVAKASHVHRLRKLHYDGVFPYTFTFDTCPIIPKLEGDKILVSSKK